MQKVNVLHNVTLNNNIAATQCVVLSICPSSTLALSEQDWYPILWTPKVS